MLKVSKFQNTRGHMRRLSKPYQKSITISLNAKYGLELKPIRKELDMLIGDIRIVDGHVRIIDVDGSHQDVPIQYALDIYEWVARHHYRLLEELRVQARGERKRGQHE